MNHIIPIFILLYLSEKLAVAMMLQISTTSDTVLMGVKVDHIVKSKWI